MGIIPQIILRSEAIFVYHVAVIYCNAVDTLYTAVQYSTQQENDNGKIVVRLQTHNLHPLYITVPS